MCAPQNAFKGGLIVTFFTAAKSSLGTMIGPLIVGTVAGCGGAVIWGPSGWGKDSGHLRHARPQHSAARESRIGFSLLTRRYIWPEPFLVPKPIWSSFAAALFFALSTDPTYTELLPTAIPQMTKDDATVRVWYGAG